jgi:hypothetical protein
MDLARQAAPLAAYRDLSSHDFVSPRIGCQTYSLYGVDLAALCLPRAKRTELGLGASVCANAGR